MADRAPSSEPSARGDGTAPARRALLGELLVARGLISAEQRDLALVAQARTGSPLGAVLVGAGHLRPQDLVATLADSWGASTLNTSVAPLVAGELDVDVDQMLDEGWAPCGRDADGTVVVVTSQQPTDLLVDHVAATLGEPVQVHVGSPWQVSRAVQEGFRAVLLDRATSSLWRTRPSASARRVLDRRQAVVGVVLLVALATGLVLEPRAVVAGLSIALSTAFLLGIAFKFTTCMVGARHEYTEVVTQAELDAVSDADLPVYTVLVPCYREAGIVGRLVENLGALDYPPEKLEILLLLEADDHETIAAARASNPPHTITLVITPEGAPRTKPKACNVGLVLARGELLVIYDAEDRPDPDQLRRAVAGFAAAGPETVCLQAALNYFNADENLLTRMFTLEYSFWFDYMLPGLDRTRMPIPLGGTSNHFRTDMLRELGGWDPYNVTEDADLGIRAAAMGYRVGVVDSTTFEEANTAYGNWIRQRSRWIKGYLQTTLVHLRHPVELVRTAGAVQALAFCLLIGGTAASFLAVIPLYLLFAVSLVLPPSVVSAFTPGWVLWLNLVNLLLGNGLMIWVTMMGAFRRRRYWLVPWALLNPAYWFLHSVAAYRALWQLITRPHYWEKTAHGLSSVDSAGSEPGDSLGLVPPLRTQRL